MSAEWGHVEIVETDAGQPFHVRLRAGNGEPLSVSEQLVDRSNAVRNIVAQAKIFGYDQPHRILDPADPNAWLLLSGLSIGGRAQALDRELVLARITFVDEREGPQEPPC